MKKKTDTYIFDEYRLRFGQTAVDMGFITAEQLKETQLEQIDDNLSRRPHRLLGQILLTKNWITLEQIELVISEISKNSEG